MLPGKYQHFDIVASLLKLLAAMEFSETDIPYVTYMLANVDGIPVSKSSSSGFWPILIKIQGECLFNTFSYFIENILKLILGFFTIYSL